MLNIPTDKYFKYPDFSLFFHLNFELIFVLFISLSILSISPFSTSQDMINHLGIYANVFLEKDGYVRAALTGAKMCF